MNVPFRMNIFVAIDLKFKIVIYYLVCLHKFKLIDSSQKKFALLLQLTTCFAMEHAVATDKVDPDWSSSVCKSVP